MHHQQQQQQQQQANAVESALDVLDADVAFLQQQRRRVGSSGPQQVLAAQTGDITLQLVNYMTINYGMAVRAQLDSLNHVFGVAALFVVADYVSSFVRTRVEHAAARPDFQRRALASAIVRALSLLVVFLGFIMVRLVIDNFQRQTQFSRRSTLTNVVMPAAAITLLFLNQLFGGYYTQGAQGPLTDKLESAWRMRRGRAISSDTDESGAR